MMFRRENSWLLLLALVVGALSSAVAVALPPPDPQLACTDRPTPSGATARPESAIFTIESAYVHSATHLQGLRATEKWTGGLIHTPALETLLSEFTSAVLVNNPDPVLSTVVNIDYFDHLGNLVGTDGPVTIPPEGSYADGADELAQGGGRGFGSARITVVSGAPIVGATVLHGGRIFDGSFEIRDPDALTFLPEMPPPPGAASMQQLQVKGSATELWWGPLPVSNVSAVDFFNGETPFYSVVNPNNSPNRLEIELTIFNRLTGGVVTVPWRQVTLPPNGSLIDISGAHLSDLGIAGAGFWNAIATGYGGAAVDLDFTVHITSLDDLPILGDGVMTDFFGDDGANKLVAGKRFRMASTMLARAPRKELLSPHFSHDASFFGGVAQTLIGVTNVGTTDAGILTIEYFTAGGGRQSIRSVPSLPPGETLRIEPGALGYGRGRNNPFGWVQISSCQPNAKLVGWSVREVLDVFSEGFQFYKAHGELLLANGGPEPGAGFVVDGNTRKVAPLNRAEKFGTFPGYSTFVNHEAPNIGVYDWRLFDFTGLDCRVPLPGPFAGLAFGRSSFTYVDPLNDCSNERNLSLRVDHEVGAIEGVVVLGDPLEEYELDVEDGFVIPLEVEEN